MTSMTSTDAPARVLLREHAPTTTIRGVRMSHLSIEVGHFYMDELAVDVDVIEERFRRIKPWIEAAVAGVRSGSNPPRVSTCFLLDDYFVRETETEADPAVVIEKILQAAKKAEVGIDYLARESACARVGEIALAELVLSKLQAEPEPGTTGARPPAQTSGWLSNGRRSPNGAGQAMRSSTWKPPVEFGARNHSVFMDVELFDHPDGGLAPGTRRYSCAFLAAVWQLLRLGVLRYDGKLPMEAQLRPVGTAWGSSWSRLPAVMQINPAAQAFSAFRTLSILPQAYLPTEHAVRSILDHVTIEEAALEQTRDRARVEGIDLPAELADRITHVFVEGPPRGGR